jgi:hypothetical protein
MVLANSLVMVGNLDVVLIHGASQLSTNGGQLRHSDGKFCNNAAQLQNHGASQLSTNERQIR